MILFSKALEGSPSSFSAWWSSAILGFLVLSYNTSLYVQHSPCQPHLEFDSLYRSCFPKQGHIHRFWVWLQTVQPSHQNNVHRKTGPLQAVACLFQKLTHSLSSRTPSSCCVYHTQTHTTFAFLVTVKKVGSHPRSVSGHSAA